MNTAFRDVAGPCLAPHGSVVCIGAFDGVHRGHRAVLERVRERAPSLGSTPVAVSFEPIPRAFFARERCRAADARRARRSRRCSMRGMRARAAAAFQRDAGGDVGGGLRRTRAGRAAGCARSLGRRRLSLRPRARAAIWRLLQRIGQRALDFSADVVPPFVLDGERVSSSRIRALLAAGDFEAAAQLLGRSFTIGGHVVRGQQLGRKLGYPTANLRARLARCAGRRHLRGARARRRRRSRCRAWPASACGRRSTARSRCSKRTCSISTAIFTVKG